MTIPISPLNASLPPRYREATFRQYEPYIAQVLEAYPLAATFEPLKTQWSLETFTCRLRDAMKSFKEHAWASSIVDHPRFAEIQPYLTVSQKGTKVIVGTKAAIRTGQVAESRIAGSPKGPITLPQPIVDVEMLKVLCHLASAGALASPLRIFLRDPQWIAKMYDSFDVDFAAEPDGAFILT